MVVFSDKLEEFLCQWLNAFWKSLLAAFLSSFFSGLYSVWLFSSGVCLVWLSSSILLVKVVIDSFTQDSVLCVWATCKKYI